MSIPATAFKAVEPGNAGFTESTQRKGINTLAGNLLRFTKADRTDLTGRPYGHLFSSFNLPITQAQRAAFLSGGTWHNTAFRGFNTDRIVVAEIPRNQYGELVDGKTIEITVPILSGTSATTITCHSSYFGGSGVNQSNADGLLSDGNAELSLFGTSPSSANGGNSNVAYLFSNQIAPPAGGGQWGQGKFRDGRKLAGFLPPAMDTPVGIAYLDKGFVVLTHPLIVDNFHHASPAARSSGLDGLASGATYTAGPNFSQIYFTSGASLKFDSVTTEFVQNIVCLAMPGEFTRSTNPTFIETYGDENAEEAPVYITEVGLWNENKELIAVAKLSQPVRKDKAGIAMFTIQLKV